MNKTTIYLPKELHVAIKELARRTGQAQATVIREAVAEYVARQVRPRLRSLGIVASGEVSSEDSEDWIRANWRPDW